MEIQLKRNQFYHLYLDESVTGRAFHLRGFFIDSKDSVLQFYDSVTDQTFLVAIDKIKYLYPDKRRKLNE